MKPVFLFVLLATLLCACCQGECEGCGIFVSFEKFNATEADTVLFVEYVPGTAQQQVRDSQWIYNPTLPADTTKSFLMRDLFCNADWTIFIPAVNRSYLVTAIQTKLEKCPCQGGKQPSVQQYAVNGTAHQEHTLVLQ